LSLQDFLGKTIKIQIIDFLAENRAFTYNQTELSQCLGVARTSVNQNLPELIFNGIVDVKETHGNVNSYQLANNELVKKLVGSVFENSFLVSKCDELEEAIKEKEIVGPINYAEECRYYCDPIETNAPKVPSYSCGAIGNIEYQKPKDNPFIQRNSWNDVPINSPASA